MTQQSMSLLWYSKICTRTSSFLKKKVSQISGHANFQINDEHGHTMSIKVAYFRSKYCFIGTPLKTVLP